MVLRSFVKINLLFCITDPLKRKSPVLNMLLKVLNLEHTIAPLKGNQLKFDIYWVQNSMVQIIHDT